MGVALKSLDQQVIVITGASSGIGLATARMAAEEGAAVVLCARNEHALQRVASDIADKGGRVSFVAADTSREEDMNRLAERAVEQFGRVDSWVNNAAAALYGEILDVPLADQKQLFDVNYWGVVHGSLAAIRVMEKSGGALINIGSILSDIHIPLQGPYVASKHAVKGFTDTLRVEVEKRGLPISVTLIKPASIDTPYTDHARVYMPHSPSLPPPRYAPNVVAEAILNACENPRRQIYVGGGGAAMIAMRRIFPGVYDWLGRNAMYDAQMTERPPNANPETRDNLYAPKTDGSERGSVANGSARETSVVTRMQMHPLLSSAVLGGAALLLGKRIADGRNNRRWASQYLPWR